MQKLCFIVFCLFHILLLPVFLCFISYFFVIFYNELFFIWLICLYIVKIIFLPILYRIFKNIYLVNDFANKLKNNKNAFITLFFMFIIDILFNVNTYKYVNNTFQEYVKTIFITCFISGGGLFISYLSYIIWLKIKELHQNTRKTEI